MDAATRWNPLIACCRQGVALLNGGWREEAIIIRDDAVPPTLLYKLTDGRHRYALTFEWNPQLIDPTFVEPLVAREFLKMWTDLRLQGSV